MDMQSIIDGVIKEAKQRQTGGSLEKIAGQAAPAGDVPAGDKIANAEKLASAVEFIVGVENPIDTSVFQTKLASVSGSDIGNTDQGRTEIQNQIMQKLSAVSGTKQDAISAVTDKIQAAGASSQSAVDGAQTGQIKGAAVQKILDSIKTATKT